MKARNRQLRQALRRMEAELCAIIDEAMAAETAKNPTFPLHLGMV